jgi:hypothetical protein
MATSTRAPNPIRWGWRIYYLLVLLRFIFVFSPGYIHPDAYFQVRTQPKPRQTILYTYQTDTEISQIIAATDE